MNMVAEKTVCKWYDIPLAVFMLSSSLFILGLTVYEMIILWMGF